MNISTTTTTTIIIIIINIIISLVQGRSIRRFDITRENIIINKDVIDIEYEFINTKEEVKLWLQVNIAINGPLILTIVRLDNISERKGEYEGSYHNRNYSDDRIWREWRGWPNNLRAKICFKGSCHHVNIPSNPLHDSMQLELEGNGDSDGDGDSDSDFKAMIIDDYNDSSLSSIPKIIHQIGSDVKGEPAMKVVEKAMLLTKLKNPSYEQIITSIDEMPEYIESLEGERVRKAFDTLKPMAYKADLFRYVALYHHGGIYMDSKLVPRAIFDKIIDESGHRSFITRDSVDSGDIQIAFLGMHPGDPLMRAAIDQIVENVENKFYGSSYLEITGPKMLGKLFNSMLKTTYYTDMILVNEYILTNVRKDIIYHNGEYRRMQHICHDKNHYSTLWNKRDIYRINTGN